MVITKAFNKQQLFEFIHSEEFSSLKNIPISKHRALSQINNPRLQDNDVLLVASFDENKTVGYLGVLPDIIFLNDEKVRFGWLTCFWVDETYKSQNVAANLFLRVIRAWNKKIMITNVVPFLEPIYQKTNLFVPTIYKKGIRAYLRLNLSEILPPKNQYFKKFKQVLKLVDWSFNSFNDFKLKSKSIHNQNVRITNISKIDEHLNGFINEKTLKGITRRAKDELNWILEYPWVLQKSEDLESSKYYFTSVSKVFKTLLFKLGDAQNNIQGVFMLINRNGNVTIPYVFASNEYSSSICEFIINYMIDNKCYMVTFYNSDLVKTFSDYKNKFLNIRETSKPYFIAKDFSALEIENFQDGDGDVAFY